VPHRPKSDGRPGTWPAALTRSGLDAGPNANILASRPAKFLA
jgi:hypothetical protein